MKLENTNDQERHLLKKFDVMQVSGMQKLIRRQLNEGDNRLCFLIKWKELGGFYEYIGLWCIMPLSKIFQSIDSNQSYFCPCRLD
jgi:hypothetical protein